METSLSFPMNLSDLSWNMKISLSTGRSSGYLRRSSNWISGQNLVLRESELVVLTRSQEADELVSENELHLNHRSLHPSPNQLVIPLRGHLIERYVSLSRCLLINRQIEKI